MLVCASFRPASEPGCGCPVTGGEGKCVQGRGEGGALRGWEPAGPAPREDDERGRRACGSGFWQTLRTPLLPTSHLHPSLLRRSIH